MKRSLKGEKGFISVFTLIFVITLGLMGLGSAFLLKSESQNVVSNIQGMQTDYAADSAMWFALQSLAIDSLNVPDTLNVGDATVYMDTSTGTGGTTMVSVEAETGLCSRAITVEITLSPGGLRGITTKGDLNPVFNSIEVWNEDGQPDPSLIRENLDKLPEIDESALQAMAVNQGNSYHGNFSTPQNLPDGYPNGSFYQADGVTPNVTYVDGNLNVPDDYDAYGIFIVTGDVMINLRAEIHGVVYVIGGGTTTLVGPMAEPYGDQPPVTGGIISGGDVQGWGANSCVVQYNSAFMDEFCAAGYVPGGGGGNAIHVEEWVYE